MSFSPSELSAFQQFTGRTRPPLPPGKVGLWWEEEAVSLRLLHWWGCTWLPSELDLRVGDYVLWKGPKVDHAEQPSKMIGKVVKIHQNRLGREVREKLGIPISGEPYAVVQLENGVLTDLDSDIDYERIQLQ